MLRTPIRFLSIVTYCFILRKSWSLPSVIRGIPTLAEILKLTRIRLPRTHLLLPCCVATLRLLMVDSSIRLFVVSTASHLVRTVPLITRDAHAVISIAKWLTLSADVLRLALAHNSCTHGLGYIIWRHRWVLLHRASMAVIDLIDIIMATFSHLILCNGHSVLVVASFLLLTGYMLI